VGVTFNAINSFTDYQSGTDLHPEAGVIQHFNVQSKLFQQFENGAGGYFYQQISPDGGSGDRVGPFIGRVAGGLADRRHHAPGRRNASDPQRSLVPRI
jgi:hypothetical protein